MGAARKKLIIPNYARDTTSPHDFVKPSKPKERARMVPMAIAVACTKCHVTGTIDMPLDADVEKIADKMLGGIVVRGFCGNCRQNVEFRPFTPDELSRDELELIGRYLENHDELVVQGTAKEALFASPGDSITKVQQATDEYMKRLRDKMKDREKGPMIQNGPQENKSGSIIIP